MGIPTAAALLPSRLKPPFSLKQHNPSSFLHKNTKIRTNKTESSVTVARLFGPSIFEASKLKVVFIGLDEENHPWEVPRTYTLTHCDITSKLTLAVSRTINTSQLEGWYQRLQRDEVVGEWKKMKGKMSLHIHCHISGGHLWLDLFAKLRLCIFRKELPLVLKAIVHGDSNWFESYPELQDAMTWVHFHSNIPEFDKVECWGPLISYSKNLSVPTITSTNHSYQVGQIT